MSSVTGATMEAKLCFISFLDLASDFAWYDFHFYFSVVLDTMFSHQTTSVSFLHIRMFGSFGEMKSNFSQFYMLYLFTSKLSVARVTF